MEIVMPKLKTETQPSALPTDRTTQPTAPSPRRRRPATRRRNSGEAIASSPQLARIEQALREAADAAFDLAHEKASSAPERTCIRRVRRAFQARTPRMPELEDLVVTADVMIRAFNLGPIDPELGQVFIHELARLLNTVATTRTSARPTIFRATPVPSALRPRVVMRPPPRGAMHPLSFDGEGFYGFA